MNENTVTMFAYQNYLGNPGPTGTSDAIFKNGLNNLPIKLAKSVSNSSTNYHGEVEIVLNLF